MERSAIDVEAYLRRIHYQGPTLPGVEVLRALHVAHLEAVPFENLDIHFGRPIVLDEEALFDKIVTRRRGGFCYELNGLFSALLRELGFPVTRLSAGVARPEGSFSPDFSHMTLLVELEDRWLADVGFGDSFREPLLFDEPGDQIRDGLAYRVTHDGRQGIMLRSGDGSAGGTGYRFGLEPRIFADYAGMCHFHQTSPESPFTQRRICTRATPEGRITLSDLRLVITAHGERREQLLTDDEWKRMLEQDFGIGPAELVFEEQKDERRS